MACSSYVVACADSHALERNSKGGAPNGYGVDGFRNREVSRLVDADVDEKKTGQSLWL
jgi:hypothetical protein